MTAVEAIRVAFALAQVYHITNANQAIDMPAYTVIANASVYTVDSTNLWVNAFAYDTSGVIIAVGTDEEVSTRVQEMATVDGGDVVTIDAEGKYIMPGFQDTHVHVIEGGLSELGVYCLMEPDQSTEQYIAALLECSENQTDSEWVRAAGATLYALRATDPSPLTLLDKAIPDRPVILLDDLGHAVWVNSLALDLAGISKDDVDPPGGIYERSPTTGAMSGLLLENAQQKARDASAFDADVLYDGLLLGLEFVASKGVTSVSDAGVYWTRGHVEAWRRAEAEGMLTARASNALYLFPDREYTSQVTALTEFYSNNQSSLLRFNTIKAYADGILDLGTAALLKPAREPIDTSLPDGMLYFTPEVLQNYTKDLAAVGFKFHYHAVGDRAVRVSLDSLEGLPEASQTDRAHRTTHTYLISSSDLRRFAELKVFADLQMAANTLNPIHSKSGLNFATPNQFRFDSNRSKTDPD